MAKPGKKGKAAEAPALHSLGATGNMILAYFKASDMVNEALPGPPPKRSLFIQGKFAAILAHSFNPIDSKILTAA